MLLIGATCCSANAMATSDSLPISAVGITFDSNNIYNWSIWQFNMATDPPTHATLANIPGCVIFPTYPVVRIHAHLPRPTLCSLYSVYASLVPSHGPSSSGDRYVFYATDVGNAAYLGVLNLSTLQLSIRRVPQLSDWTEIACDSTMYAKHRHLRMHMNVVWTSSLCIFA